MIIYCRPLDSQKTVCLLLINPMGNKTLSIQRTLSLVKYGNFITVNLEIYIILDRPLLINTVCLNQG